MHDAMNTFTELKGGELKEADWRCEDVLNNMYLLKTNVNLN